MKTYNLKLLREIIECVELNYETLACSNLTSFDIFKIFSLYFPLIIATILFVCFLTYVYISISESELDAIISVATISFALIMLIEANKERGKRLKDVEIIHNIRRIKKDYSEGKLIETHYPIIRIILSLKQKYPETDLRQFYKLNKNFFNEKTLLGLILHDFGS